MTKLLILIILIISCFSQAASLSNKLFCDQEFESPFIKYLKKYSNKNLSIDDFHIEVKGQEHEEAIVLIHGLDSAGGTFYNVVDELALKYKVILYDQRGHGRTADINNNFGSVEMANDLKLILDHLKVNKAHVLGHSMGARTATRFVEKYPEMSLSLIVEDMDLFKRIDKPLNTKLLDQYYSFHDKLKTTFKGKTYKTREDLRQALEPFWGDEAESHI